MKTSKYGNLNNISARVEMTLAVVGSEDVVMWEDCFILINAHTRAWVRVYVYTSYRTYVVIM